MGINCGYLDFFFFTNIQNLLCRFHFASKIVLIFLFHWNFIQVVTRSNNVWNACWISSVLCRWPNNNMQKGNTSYASMGIFIWTPTYLWNLFSLSFFFSFVYLFISFSSITFVMGSKYQSISGNPKYWNLLFFGFQRESLIANEKKNKVGTSFIPSFIFFPFFIIKFCFISWWTCDLLVPEPY